MGLTNGTTYFFVVSAVNGVGESVNSAQVSATPQAATFTLQASPSSLTVARGASGTSTIAIVRTSFPGSVTLSATGLPAGVSASFAPASTTGNSSVLTLAASASATLGAATVTVTGTSGALTRTTTIALTVTAGGGGGAATATPVVTANSPWFGEQQVRLANTATLTALTVQIVIQRTPGVAFSGLYNTVGGVITQSNASTRDRDHLHVHPGRRPDPVAVRQPHVRGAAQRQRHRAPHHRRHLDGHVHERRHHVDAVGHVLVERREPCERRFGRSPQPRCHCWEPCRPSPTG